MGKMRLHGNTAATNERVPRLGPGVDPTRLELTPAEGYLLSRIDGATSWTHLRAIGGIGPDEVDRCLERWVAAGVVVVDGHRPPLRASAPPQSPLATETASPEASAKPTPPREIDASLDIPVEVQERIFEFEAKLDAPYYEILGVPRDADRKALRKAYFALSKELHPDRFFRRNVGPFGKRLERIFGKIVEAYELLSDPMARAEIERSLAAASGDASEAAGVVAEAATAAAPESAPEAPPETGSQRATPAPPLRSRRPHVFSLHSRIVRDRRARAKRLFEAGMASFSGGRWLEAAGSVRLAIAFDPWNAIYKEQFGDVQRKAHEERAKQLVREAEAALELRDFPIALRAFSEALEYRPHDADLLHRAARLAWATGGDLHQAKEWAMAAVELDGTNAAHHRVLGQVYKAAGLEANAKRELEAALAIDPKDEEARAELRAFGGRALRWLGGKR
jgi:curved DNA-binding protein CbpA